MAWLYWVKACLLLVGGAGVATLVSMFGIHLYINDFPRRRKLCNSKARLNGKTVLITGCNQGIGYETARDLADRGARIIMGCRNLTRAKIAMKKITDSTGNTNIVALPLDLSDLDSVRAFADEVIASETYLHVLINNAGISHDAKNTKTKQGYDMTFGTNYLGPFLLTYLLLDLLKKSAPSRVVNVASIVYRAAPGLDFTERDDQGNPYPKLEMYPASKLGNVLHSRELAKKLEGTGVTTYSVCPGFIKTSIFEATKEADVHSVVKTLLKIQEMIMHLIALDWKMGAQTTLHCALEDSLETVSGRYYDNCRDIPLSGKYATDDKLAKRLWDVSMQMSGLS